MKTTKLEKLSACADAIKYVKFQKSPEKAWANCDRGDWRIWLAKRLNVDDRLLTLVKATCANQFRPLMTDQRSLDAIDACFQYAKGGLTREELNVYADAAYTAHQRINYIAHYGSFYDSSASTAAVLYATISAAAAAYYDTTADAFAAYVRDYDAAAADYAAYVHHASSRKSKGVLKKSVDICGEILTTIVIENYNK
jgi:hypothetical protein